jgi:hypothetical protein
MNPSLERESDELNILLSFDSAASNDKSFDLINE